MNQDEIGQIALGVPALREVFVISLPECLLVRHWSRDEKKDADTPSVHLGSTYRNAQDVLTLLEKPGSISMVTIEADSGMILLADLKRGLLVAYLFDQSAPLGLVRVQARQLTEHLRGVADQILGSHLRTPPTSIGQDLEPPPTGTSLPEVVSLAATGSSLPEKVSAAATGSPSPSTGSSLPEEISLAANGPSLPSTGSSLPEEISLAATGRSLPSTGSSLPEEISLAATDLPPPSSLGALPNRSPSVNVTEEDRGEAIERAIEQIGREVEMEEPPILSDEDVTPVPVSAITSERLMKADMNPVDEPESEEDLPAVTEEAPAPPPRPRGARLLDFFRRYAPDPHASFLRLSLRTGIPLEDLEHPERLSDDQVDKLAASVRDILGQEQMTI